MIDYNKAWLKALDDVLTKGVKVSPRGQETLELPQYTMEIDITKPVLTIKDRKLSYVFMAAEAYWILAGFDTVADIAPYNSRIAKFSDDGVVFKGAYGPEVVKQLDYVVNKLSEDPDTRQAVLTIWRQNPEPSKDIPCTVALSFMIRNKQLNCHVFMRSNDLWLGNPYDVFNFSMLSALVCAKLNAKSYADGQIISVTTPGTLYLTAASSHLYKQHWEIAKTINAESKYSLESLPTKLFVGLSAEKTLMDTLFDMREVSGKHLRWWN